MKFVVAINKFSSDTKAEISLLENWAKEKGYPIALSNVFELGGVGGVELANKVLDIVDANESKFEVLYDENLPIKDKIITICKEVYGAISVEFSKKALTKLEDISANNWNNLCVCMAKTQYSLSDNAKLLGRPTDFTVKVKDLKPSIGAGFIVALCGSILTMPGLPKEPAANNMDLIDDKAVGLF